MDGEKAKRYLIVAFLVTDLLLGFFVVLQLRERSGTLDSAAQERHIRAVLKEHSIDLRASLPWNTPSKGILQVKDDPACETLGRPFLTGESRQSAPGQGQRILQERFTEPFQEASLRRAADRWLRQKKVAGKFRFTKHQAQKDALHFEYTYVYQGDLVEDGRLLFEFLPSGELFIHIKCIQITLSSKEKRPVITPGQALLRSLDQLVAGRAVTQVELVYRQLDSKDDPFVRKPPRKVMPFWRIRQEDGAIFYTDAIEY